MLDRRTFGFPSIRRSEELNRDGPLFREGGCHASVVSEASRVSADYDEQSSKRKATQTMNKHQNEQQPNSFLDDCERIHREWHERARTVDTDGLLTLYAEDAVLESPLVPAILDDKRDGVLRGHGELRHFFTEGAKRRPNDLVRWYRTGEWLTDGRRLLIWEYPRETPEGDQVDLVEVMWRGCALIAPALSHRTTA